MDARNTAHTRAAATGFHERIEHKESSCSATAVGWTCFCGAHNATASLVCGRCKVTIAQPKLIVGKFRCTCPTNQCLKQDGRVCEKTLWPDLFRQEPTRTEQRAAGEAQMAEKKRLRVHNPQFEIPRANYAMAVLEALDSLRLVMIYRHSPEDVQKLARKGLDLITTLISK